jgi:hypothetical protein
VTLTSAVLYLTILMHTQNRMQQAALLQQQRLVLSDFYEPKEPEPEPAARVVPVGLVEMAKDRWNRLAQSEGICGGEGELVTRATTHEDEDANNCSALDDRPALYNSFPRFSMSCDTSDIKDALTLPIE